MIPMMKLTMTYENKTNAMPTMTLMRVCLSWLWAFFRARDGPKSAPDQ